MTVFFIENSILAYCVIIVLVCLLFKNVIEFNNETNYFFFVCRYSAAATNIGSAKRHCLLQMVKLN